VAPGQVASLLDELVSRSLVVLDAAASPSRFRFAPLAYQFARDLLRANGEESMLEQRLADYLVSATAEVPPELVDETHADLLDKEIGNLDAALRWAVRSANADVALNLGIARYPQWYLRGRFRKGEAWLSRCLSIPTSPAQRSNQTMVAILAAHLALLEGRTRRARDLLESARAAELADGNALSISFTATFLALVEFWCGNLESADARHGEAMAAFQQVVEKSRLSQWDEAAVTNIGARIAVELGNYPEADELARRAAFLAQTRGDRFWHARALHVQALVAAQAGLHDVADSLIAAAVESHRQLGDGDGLIDSLCSTGAITYDLGRTADALAAFVEAVSLAQLSGHRHGMAWALEGIAHALPLTQSRDAFSLLGVARTLRQELESVPRPSQLRRSAHWQASANAVIRASGLTTPQETDPPWSLAHALDFISSLSASRSTSISILTARERQVIQLHVHGLSQGEVAETLGISTRTVRSHVDHMLLKLEMHSTAQLVAWALRQL
jgi:DNA-binding CsgD family transcriptional regulator/tetratricopeptide (TPR) repeat protein